MMELSDQFGGAVLVWVEMRGRMRSTVAKEDTASQLSA
jgi:hypothetical protein